VIISIIERKLSENDQSAVESLLNVLNMPVPQMDAVDGFLKALGEVLRRLPYEKRARLQIKLLTVAVNKELK